MSRRAPAPFPQPEQVYKSTRAIAPRVIHRQHATLSAVFFAISFGFDEEHILPYSHLYVVPGIEIKKIIRRLK